MDWLRRILNLPPQGAPIAEQIDDLHFFVIAVTTIGAVGVALAAMYFGWRYRRGSGRHRPLAATSMRIELLIAAGLLGLFVLWWAIGWAVYRQIVLPPEEAALDIQVVAKQWMWKFIYPDGRELIDELVLPAGQAVRLHLTSRDVIHSLYLPAFRLKKDALPHMSTLLWVEPSQPGEHQLLCTEYCGLSHSDMLGVVRVLDPAAWAAWQEDVEGPDLVERGRQAAIRHGCLSCHTIDGQPHIGPSWYGRFGDLAQLQDGSEVVVDERYLSESMMDPRAKLVVGYDDVMPTYRGLLSAVDAAAIVAYIRHLQADPAQQVPETLDEVAEPLRRGAGEAAP